MNGLRVCRFGEPPIVEMLEKHLPPRGLHAIGTCLILDADRTLAPEDSGRLIARALGVDDRIRSTFAAMGYTDAAFVAVSQIWSTICPSVYREQINMTCENVTIYRFWIDVLTAIAGRIPVFVITAGIPQVWRGVLGRAGLGAIPVLGGCHSELDSYLVSSTTKADLVTAIQALGWIVVAAGDGPIDLQMLKAADVPLFVPDAKGSPVLRTLLHDVPKIRHATVDERRFNPLRPCTSEQVVRMIFEGGYSDAF